jgi:predicted ArsR family transcriptional regulator
MKSLTQKQKILLVLAKRGSLTLEELERYTKIPRNSLLKNLSELTKEGKITRGCTLQVKNIENTLLRRRYSKNSVLSNI